MEEIWKPIKGYESLYEVSNLGNIKSFDRVVYKKNGVVEHKKGKIRKPNKTRNGYLQVFLYKDKIYKVFRIHRLVAEAFLPNTDNLPCVNHKDEDKTNNRVDNLEWCSYEYNIHYGTAIERGRYTQSKPVNQYTLDGVLVKEWKSTFDAADSLGIKRCNISLCCTGYQKTSNGFKWFYADDSTQYIDQPLF